MLRPVQTSRQATTPRRSAGTQTHAAYPFAAPVRGIDVSQPLPGGNPLTAIRMDNLIPRVLGCQLRKGYSRWVSNMGGEIRTLMAFQPADAAVELFAASSNGSVYDITTPQPSGFLPPPVLTTSGGLPPGEWSWLNFTTTPGVHVLIAVCAGVGMYVYDGATWTQITAGAAVNQIDNVDPVVFDYVMVYQGRLWFIENESTRAWYLPPGVYAGAATEFDFGAMMPNGGWLAGMINWTFDGSGGSGAGLTNKLVLIGSQGDVNVYEGDDPSDPTVFKAVGRWYVGRTPVGHRFFSLYASDVAIVSEKGLNFMSELMRGDGFHGNPQIASQINSELAVQVANTLDTRYWEIVYLPHEQLLVINLPEYNNENRQWAYEVNNKAFCNLLGYPMNTVLCNNGKTLCGDLVGNVWWCFQGQSDGEVDGTAGQDLLGTVVTAFQPLGEGMRVKRFLMVRPSFISTAVPGVRAQLNKEWSLLLPPGAPAFIKAGEDFWDSGSWDNATWTGTGRAYEAWLGAVGAGRYGSLSMQVRGPADTIFVGWQAVVEQGGIL